MSDQPARPDRPATSAIPHWYQEGSDVLSLDRGEGVTVYDADGNAYLDFISQLYCVNAGHSNEAIIDAIADQLRRIPYVSSAKDNETRSALAARLGEVAPVPDPDVFFSISGSEANEAAIQLAREYQDAPKILTRWRSYHGATYGAAALTGDPQTRATVERYAATTGVARFLPPLAHRSPFNADSPEELAELAADHLEFVIRNEDPDSIAAVLMEPVGGTSGAYPAPPGYFQRVRELCDAYDILLIADEVITGFGRCGDWFGIQTEDVVPDMITFAKGATSAYVPLAGVIARGEIGDHFEAAGIEVGQTFAGHPVGCAAGVAALDEYGSGLIDNVRELAPVLEGQLRDIEAAHDVVGSVHGRGFLWAVEFTDPETGEPFLHTFAESGDNPVADVREVAQAERVLFGGGRPDTQVILAPPLCAEESDLSRATAVLDEAIATIFG